MDPNILLSAFLPLCRQMIKSSRPPSCSKHCFCPCYRGSAFACATRGSVVAQWAKPQTPSGCRLNLPWADRPSTALVKKLLLMAWCISQAAVCGCFTSHCYVICQDHHLCSLFASIAMLSLSQAWQAQLPQPLCAGLHAPGWSSTWQMDSCWRIRARVF